MPLPVVLVDLDRTLADSRWRDHLIDSEGFDAFHSEGHADPPIQPVVDLTRALAPGHCVVGLTGRNERFRQLTLNWCLKHGVHLDELLMRPDDDYRPAPQMKMAVAQERFGENLDGVVIMIDDEPKILAEFANAGVVTLLVTIPGTEEDDDA